MELPQPCTAYRGRRRAGGARLLIAGSALAVAAIFSANTEPEVALVAAAGSSPSIDGASAGGTMVEKVVASAAQGAVAAFVAAWLSAFTEPVVNRLLVQRATVAEAINSVKVQDCLKFFLTTFPTNMLKFPAFEVINTVLSTTSLTGPVRGIVNGALFCTLMLPVTNFRFRKSMNLPIESFGQLYQAYPPTVMRDIIYGWARGTFAGVISGAFNDSLGQSFLGKCVMFGLTIWVACIVSSPCNELRGYWLQPPDRKLSFQQFFQPSRYVRSTGVGATIMGISLSVGMAITPAVKSVVAVLADSPLVCFIVLVLGLAAFYKLLSKK